MKLAQRLLPAVLLVALLVGCKLQDVGQIFSPRSQAPFVSPDGLTVLVLNDPSPEAQRALTDSQSEILHVSGKVRQWCEQNCAKDSAGNPQFRCVDPKNPMDRELDPRWREAIAVEHPLAPCVIAACKSRGLIAPITPGTTPESVIAALTKVKGS